MADYIIRNIDPALWRKVKARAAIEGKSVKDVITALLRDYAAGKEQKK